ncbi:hypothetical protein BGZ70_009407, partial [Mortierella alpina]
SSKPDMVLEQYSNVKWFTPAKAKAPQDSSRASSPHCPQRWRRQDLAQAPADLTVTPKPVTQDAPAPVSAPSSTAVDPWSVYGPTFERMACRGGRSGSSRLGKEVLRNVLPSPPAPQDPDASSKGRRRIPGQQQQRFVYPSDSILSSSSAQRSIAGLLSPDFDATSDPEDASGSDLSYDDEYLTLEDAFTSKSLLAHKQDIYFADMPLELLNHIFLDFMCISSDSLHRLAQERSEARTKASQQASATAASAVSSGTLSTRSGNEATRVSSRQLANSTHDCRQLVRDNHVVRSHHQHRHHQRLRHVHHHRHRHHYHEHSSEQGLFQELQSASPASSSRSSSSSSFSSHLGANALFSGTASNLFLVTDQDLSYDGEEEEEDNENDSGSDTSDTRSLDDSNVAASSSVGTIPDFTEVGSDSYESTSSEDGVTDHLEESGDSGSHDIDYAYRDDTATLSATSSSHLTSITSSSSTIGINRVDNDLEEDKMIYQLHRDHRPRSSLKGLSSHQLDAVMSLPSPPLSSSSSSSSSTSSSFSTRIVRTRLEAMLDSYQDLYGLDLAKCVQTVELDLRLLVWSAEGESVKRILRRLSPFTHLRLVWAGKESPEEMMTGFKVAMESLHSQIRHLHFFSGFVISPAWTREMAKMTKLQTVTIESLGSLDAIEYDWTRLKCLKLHSVIPRSVFRCSVKALGATGLLSSATATTPLHGSATAMYHHFNHPERLGNVGSGWWQWTGLRRLDLQLKNMVLPKEWLQDLTAAIAQNSAMLTKQEHYLHQQRLVTGKQALLPSSRSSFPAVDYEQEGISSYGPPLEILNIDCEVSHQHKDILMDLVRVWGHRMEEFHFSHSGELTDEFLWLCLVRMTRLKKLSLRDSKGITGEGVSRRQKVDASESENLLKALGVVGALAVPEPTSMGHANSSGVLDPEQSDKAPLRKAAKVPIRWRRDFKELNLDQSRVRQEFLQTLRQRCPGVVYKVREVRQKTL